MKRLKLTITTACAALLSLTAPPSVAQVTGSHAQLAQAGTPDVPTPRTQRKMAPDFTLPDATGQRIAVVDKGSFESHIQSLLK